MKRVLQHGRTLRLDPGSLSSAMNRCGMSVEELAYATDTSTGSVNNWLSGKPAYRSTAQRVADALQTNIVALLEPVAQLSAAQAIHEYVLAEILTDWRATSNGLQYQVCRLRHSELDRQARGKRFDLRELPTDVAQQYETRIKRHPNVCDSLREHLNVISNLSAFKDPVEHFYWIVDEWIDGLSLSSHLTKPGFDIGAKRKMLLDIAQGLDALHSVGIIRRELSPDNIIVRAIDFRCVLTEFELAKLGEQVPTVSHGGWPTDMYRAPEVVTGDIDTTADIYSWCRIATHLLACELPAIGSELETLKQLQLPPGLTSLIADGLSIFRDARPACIAEIIAAIREWSPKQ